MKHNFYYSASRITVDGYDNGDIVRGYFDSIPEARKEIRRQLKESYCLGRHNITAELQCFRSGLCGNYTPAVRTITVA